MLTRRSFLAAAPVVAVPTLTSCSSLGIGPAVKSGDVRRAIADLRREAKTHRALQVRLSHKHVTLTTERGEWQWRHGRTTLDSTKSGSRDLPFALDDVPWLDLDEYARRSGLSGEDFAVVFSRRSAWTSRPTAFASVRKPDRHLFLDETDHPLKEIDFSSFDGMRQGLDEMRRLLPADQTIHEFRWSIGEEIELSHPVTNLVEAQHSGNRASLRRYARSREISRHKATKPQPIRPLATLDLSLIQRAHDGLRAQSVTPLHCFAAHDLEGRFRYSATGKKDGREVAYILDERGNEVR